MERYTKRNFKMLSNIRSTRERICRFLYQFGQQDRTVIHYIQNSIKEDGLVTVGTVTQRNDLEFN